MRQYFITTYKQTTGSGDRKKKRERKMKIPFWKW
jgi:hypothetical protein